MNAVILCAGFGTRMYPLTKNFPKPLLEVGGKPVLDYLIEQMLPLPGLESIHIVTNDRFYQPFVNWNHKKKAKSSFAGVKMHIHNDGCTRNDNRLGAAADLLFGLKKIGRPSRVLVAGGDNIFQFSLTSLWERFLWSKDHHVVALIENELEKLQKTGVLEIGEDDCVLELHEKPHNPPSNRTCPPLYFFQPSIITMLEDFLQNPGNHDAPGYFIQYLCKKVEVKAFKLDSGRLDIGCLQTFKDADQLLSKRQNT